MSQSEEARSDRATAIRDLLDPAAYQRIYAHWISLGFIHDKAEALAPEAALEIAIDKLAKSQINLAVPIGSQEDTIVTLNRTLNRMASELQSPQPGHGGHGF